MAKQNQIYMNIQPQQNNHVEEEKESFIKEQVKEQIQEETLELGLEKLTEDVSIEMVDGIVNITMPEPLFLLFKSLFKKLNINLLNESEQQR